MSMDEFVWSDLSTFDLATAKSDYAAIFGWKIVEGGGYDLALSDGTAIAAFFTMPDWLQKINMPSFWMSYVEVADVRATTEHAKRLGAIIEIDVQDFGNGGRFALVRDPSGAGFTIYEGPSLSTRRSRSSETMCRYHHLADVRGIEPFYSELFGWQFSPLEGRRWPSHRITSSTGNEIAIVEEMPAEVRGTFSYWMPCFGVGNLVNVCAELENCGGAIAVDLQDGRLIVSDRQGAHFMLNETKRSWLGSLFN